MEQAHKSLQTQYCLSSPPTEADVRSTPKHVCISTAAHPPKQLVNNCLPRTEHHTCCIVIYVYIFVIFLIFRMPFLAFYLIGAGDG